MAILERLRRRLERTAARAQARQELVLRAALEQAPEAVTAADAQGRLVYVNEAARELTGAREGQDVETLERRWRFWDPEGQAEKPPEELPLALALRGRPVEDAALLLKTPARPEGVHVRASARPLFDANGEPLGAVCLLREDKRREQEQALRRFAGIVESSLDAIITRAPDGTVLTWNGGAERLFGYRAPEVTGRPFSILVPPEREAENERILKPALRGDTVHAETAFLRKDGARLDVFLTAAPVRDQAGRIVGASVIAHDITSRRRTERENAQKAAMLDLAHDAVLARDVEGRITYWSRGAEQTYGWSAQEARGRLVHELLVTVYPAPVREMEEQAAAKGEWRGELRHTRKDGQTVVVASRWAAVKDEQGRVTGYLEVNRDETPRVRAQAELRAVLDEMPAVAFMKDAEGRYLYVNRRFEAVFRVPSAKALRKTDFDLFARPVAEAARASDRRALESAAPIELETALDGPDGPHAYLIVKFALRDELGRPYAVCGIDLDISQRVRAEADAREREERLNAALAAASAGTWRLDLRTGKLSWDENNRRLFGVSPDAELTVETALSLIDERDRPSVKAELERCARDGGDYGVEYRVARPDGTRRWLSAKARTYFDRAGRPLYLTGATMDVTDARERRRALAESEARQRLLYENVKGFAFIFLDAQGRVESWNSSAERLLGYSARDIVGRHYGFIYTPQALSAGEPEAHMRAALAQGRAESEGFRVRKDGSLLYVNVVMTTLRDEQGRLRGFAKIMRDITESRQALEALRRSEARFRALAEASPAGVFQSDEQGRLVYVNARAAEIIGLSPEDALGEGWRRRVHPDDAGRVEALRGRKGERFSLEHRYLHKDGRVVWVLALGAAMRDEAGRVAGYVGTLTDITERREAEERLRRTLSELERSNTELEQFAYIASHDLQEPLRKVASFAELLDRRFGRQLGPDGERFIRYIIDGASRMRQLIVDLLNYSRLGRGELDLKEVDVDRLVGSVLDTLEPRIVEAHGRVSRGRLPALTADPGQLEQLFLNLLSNALKFSRAGAPPEISIEAQKEGPDWRFCVQDNGIGIEPELVAKLFVPFRRLHSREEYPGTGIGLAICRRVVERHGGRIWVEPAPSGGSRFCFTLPVSPERRAS